MFNGARQKLAGDGPIVDLAGSLKVIPGDLNLVFQKDRQRVAHGRKMRLGQPCSSV
jgi:hypothetical protein